MCGWLRIIIISRAPKIIRNLRPVTCQRRIIRMSPFTDLTYKSPSRNQIKSNQILLFKVSVSNEKRSPKANITDIIKQLPKISFRQVNKLTWHYIYKIRLNIHQGYTVTYKHVKTIPNISFTQAAPALPYIFYKIMHTRHNFVGEIRILSMKSVSICILHRCIAKTFTRFISRCSLRKKSRHCVIKIDSQQQITKIWPLLYVTWQSD